MDEKIDVITVRLSPELLLIVDSLIEKGLYSSRSEAIRDLCRNYALEERYRQERAQ